MVDETDAARGVFRWGVEAVALALLWFVVVWARDWLGASWAFDLIPGNGPVLQPFDAERMVTWGGLFWAAWCGVGVVRRPPRRRQGPAGLSWTEALWTAGGATVVVVLLDWALAWPHLSRTLSVGFAAGSVPVLWASWRLAEAVERMWPAPQWHAIAVGPALPLRAGPGLRWVARLDATAAHGPGLWELVAREPVDALWVTAGAPVQTVSSVAELAAAVGLDLVVDVEVLGLPGARGHDPVTLRFRRRKGLDGALKRALDVLGATLLLVGTAPLLVAAAAAIWWEDGGPVLFRQVRAGRGGRPFVLYKLRSMRRGAEADQHALSAHNEADGPVFKLSQDPRVTRVGRVLRRWSVDELPQAVNVLRGEMSLVGPRPPLPDEVLRYTPSQRRRLAVRPGLTCTWQVSGRSDLDFATWMAMDLDYVDHGSLGWDLLLLVQTLPAVLSGRGAR